MYAKQIKCEAGSKCGESEVTMGQGETEVVGLALEFVKSGVLR